MIRRSHCLRTATNRFPAGFTLIELLVVLVLLGFVSGLVVLSIGDNQPRKLRKEAERLQNLLVAATDEAIFSATDYGLFLEEQGYELKAFNLVEGKWDSRNDQAFSQHMLAKGILLSWEIEGFRRLRDDEQGETVEFTSDDESGSDTARNPQLLIMSSGEITPFVLELRSKTSADDDISIRVLSDGFALPEIRDTPLN